MKTTLIRTTKTNKYFAKRQVLDEVVKHISRGLYAKEVDELHKFLHYAETSSRFHLMHRLPIVYPSAEMKIDESGNRVMQHFNGLLTLSVGKLHDREEADAVKCVATTYRKSVVLRSASGTRCAVQ